MGLRSNWPVVWGCLQHLNNEVSLYSFCWQPTKRSMAQVNLAVASASHSYCPEQWSGSLHLYQASSMFQVVPVRQCNYFCVLFLTIIRKLHCRLLVSSSVPSLHVKCPSAYKIQQFHCVTGAGSPAWRCTGWCCLPGTDVGGSGLLVDGTRCVSPAESLGMSSWLCKCAWMTLRCLGTSKAKQVYLVFYWRYWSLGYKDCVGLRSGCWKILEF